MTVLAITLAMPHTGKRLATENRARQLGGIYARHGASVKITNVVSGPNSGGIALIRGYPDFRTASQTLQAIHTDPAHLEFWREREANPAADIVITRDIARRIYGEGQWSTHPVSLIRQYDLTRDKVAEALKLLSDVDQLISKSDVNVVGLLPVTGENLSSMSISYQFCSMDHLGEALDTVGTSDAFQQLVAQASEIGTLRSAFIMTPL